VRVGIFGGSFDPIHIGHLIVAEHAGERLGLERVYFVPARQHPFKAGHGASPEDRLAMVELAIRGNPRFVVDGREIQRPGPSYTVETVRALATELEGNPLFLLLGADAAREFPAWREADTIAALATVVVLTRAGVELPALPWVKQVVEVPGIEVSASGLREAVRQGRSIRYLVPAAVEDYIRARGLYRDRGVC
jgi:nicotinate-nucleotide adenylyltransferase